MHPFNTVLSLDYYNLCREYVFISLTSKSATTGGEDLLQNKSGQWEKINFY